MKNTYLVFVDPTNPTSGLREASKTEWDQILKLNRELKREHRRFFIRDSFEDNGEIDCMFIETTRDAYDKWHSEYQERYRKRKLGKKYMVFSLSESVSFSDEELEIEETISNGFNLEDETIYGCILLDELRKALLQRDEWEIEFLDHCLNGTFKKCNKEMKEKYHISHETLNRRKQKFLRFVKNFLNGVEN